DIRSGERRMDLLEERIRALNSDLGAKNTLMMSISSQTDNGDLEATFKSKTQQLNKLDETMVELKLKLDELTTVLPTTMPSKTAANDPKKWTVGMIARMDPHSR